MSDFSVEGVIEVVLTGGPCAGKSSALSYLTQKLTERGYRVFTPCEVATMLITGGVFDIGELAALQDERFWAFEKRMFAFQGDMRKHYKQLASDFYNVKNQKIAIIYDRAEADIQAYVGKDGFERLISECDSSLIAARDSYDLVIHMVTAALGAEEFYTTENNPARWETPEQAREADVKTLNAWVGHPHLQIVDNRGNFASKLDHVLSLVLNALGEPPLEIERKYKLATMPSLAQLTKAKAVQIEIEQTYLMSADSTREIRVRSRRMGNGEVAYYRTKKRTLPNGIGRAESERMIDHRTATELLLMADPTRTTIKKTRWCFAHGSQHFELDEFHTPAGLVMLEAELPNENTEVKIPAWLGEVEEVTDDPAYKNYELSVK